MSSVLITDTYLTNIANSIRTKNGLSDTYTVAEMSGAIAALPTSSYTLIHSEELVADNITSTTAATFKTIQLGSEAYTSAAMIYVKVRDKAGPRNGYYYGNDAFYCNCYPVNGVTTAINSVKLTYRIESDGSFGFTDAGYGFYPYTIYSTGAFIIRRRYHSTYTLTFDGTYVLEVYKLQWPGNVSPFITGGSS